MNIFWVIYFSTVLILAICNLKFYTKATKEEGTEKLSKLIYFFILCFLGPISILINLHRAFLSIRYKINNIIKKHKLKKMLESMIEEKLQEAIKKENSIKIS